MDKKTIKAFAKREERYVREREEREEFQAKCDHKYVKKGKLQSTLRNIEGSDTELKCTVCGARVNFDAISQKELAEAVDTIRMMLHQVKSVQDITNEDIIAQIGFVGMFLNRAEDLYKGTRKELSRRVDGRQEDRFDYDYDDFGNYARGHRPMTIDDYAKSQKKKKNKDKDKKKKNNKKKKDAWYR